jgi:hypothetical protein
MVGSGTMGIVDIRGDSDDPHGRRLHAGKLDDRIR